GCRAPSRRPATTRSWCAARGCPAASRCPRKARTGSSWAFAIGGSPSRGGDPRGARSTLVRVMREGGGSARRAPGRPPRVFSGIQPSGDMHLGNYLGAVRRWVERQAARENYFCLVDLHSLTIPH